MSESESQHIAYYDGQCGLCHLAVVFLLKHDRSGSLYFMPTQTAAYREFARSKGIAISPRSVLVWDSRSGALLSETAAVLRLLRRCGPRWSGVAGLLERVPLPVLNFVYRAIARVRHRLFRAPRTLWPDIPEKLRDRLIRDLS